MIETILLVFVKVLGMIALFVLGAAIYAVYGN